MNYMILVNKNNPLSRSYVPDDLVVVSSKYKDNILLDRNCYEAFCKLKEEASNNNYDIDIMSGYRSYDYQEKIYHKLLQEKGYCYAVTRIAEPGKSEHQTGLAIDFCVYKDNRCYIENDIKELDETKWIHDNSYRYGFILRYNEGKENITKYSYEPWHLRYLGDIKLCKYLYDNNLSFEEYLENNINF